MTPDDLRRELEGTHADAFGWALNCCNWVRAEAEDALQASYLKVLDGRARWDGRSSFRTWLFGVVRRTAAERRRGLLRYRERLERWVSGIGSDTRSTEAGAFEQIVRSETNRTLVSTLAQLPERQRQVLHLVFYQDLTIAQAADVMAVSLGTARTHYERGKKRLRELLEGELDR